VRGGELDRGPAAEGFAVEMGAADAEHVHQAGQVIDIVG
jgi:hypothetical protein